MYCYKQTGTDPNLWTVGFYDPCSEWHPESDHTSWEAAADRVAWLNGGGEREACAKIADAQSSKAPFGTTHEDEAYASGVERASENIAEAIRART
jgi:hypothetical protein